jgi:hypothetical protein
MSAVEFGQYHKTLLYRKDEIRQKWAKSDKAANMSLVEFGQYLIALDEAETQKELEELKARWNTAG